MKVDPSQIECYGPSDNAVRASIPLPASRLDFHADDSRDE